MNPIESLGESENIANIDVIRESVLPIYCRQKDRYIDPFDDVRKKDLKVNHGGTIIWLSFGEIQEKPKLFNTKEKKLLDHDKLVQSRNEFLHQSPLFDRLS